MGRFRCCQVFMVDLVPAIGLKFPNDLFCGTASGSGPVIKGLGGVDEYSRWLEE